MRLAISDLDLERAFDGFRRLAAELGLPAPRGFDRDRRSRLRALLAEHGREAFELALAKIRGSPFCRGDNDRGWRIDFDALCQRKTFRNLIEGRYDDRDKRSTRTENREAIARAVAESRSGIAGER